MPSAVDGGFGEFDNPAVGEPGTMSDQLCRWGILGTARIARKNWHSIRNAGNGTLAAVASRDRGRAEQFIRECQQRVPFIQPPRAATYDELLNDPDVDAVYIPLPTAIRKEWVLRAARAGKHVLSEKPCGVTAADVREMLDACRDQGVQFMDGVMFVHSGRLAKMREMLLDGTSVGDIRRIASQFSFRGEDEFLSHNIRTQHQLEPLGCLGDLGWYNIRFSLWALGDQRPKRVSGRMLAELRAPAGDSPVPLEFSGELLFAGGVSAGFYCSFVTGMQQWADVSGTTGRLFVRDFVVPYYGSRAAFEIHSDALVVDGCQFNLESHSRRFWVPEYSNNAPSAQETNLFRRFSEIVASGQLDPSWGEATLLTQEVLDACLESSRLDGAPVAL
jgi:predicted dehydrogenase